MGKKVVSSVLAFAAILGSVAILATGCINPVGGPPQSKSTPSGGSSQSNPTTPTTATAILSSLGVREVSAPPPASITAQNGDPVTVDPDSWQPLKSTYAVFSPRSEVFQAGGSVNNRWNTYYSDAQRGYAPSVPFNETDQSWAKLSAKTAVAADLRGDGLKSVVIFYAKLRTDSNLYVRVYSPAGGAGGEHVVSGVTLQTTAGKTVFDHGAMSGRLGIGTPWIRYFNSCAADLDGSGRDKIILSAYDTVFIISVDPSGTATSESAWRPLAQVAVSGVAAGDCNGDGRDEIAVGLADGKYYLCQSNFLDQWSADRGSSAPVEAAFGNFAGTNIDQLALCTRDSATGNIQVSLYSFPISTSGGITATFGLLTRFQDNYNPVLPNGGTADYYRMVPRAIDINGSGKDQLEVLGRVYANPTGLTGTPTPTYTVEGSFPNTDDNTVVDVKVGDLDNDGKQDMVVLSCSRDNGWDRVCSYGLNSSGLIAAKHWFIPTDTNTPDQFGSTTCIAVGNFEDNSPRVRYAGHTLTFTDPIVVAALASPPYWADVAEADSGYANAYPGWNTTFGETQANSSDTSTSVGFSVGCSIEYEQKASIFGITIADFKSSVSFEYNTSWEWSQSYEVSKEVQYNCPAGENMVVFTSVPIDQYRYQVVSTNDPDSPVGSYLSINIPRDCSTYFVTQDFFNSHIGSGIVPPIDGSVFSHTVGKPETYPSPSQEVRLMSDAFGSGSPAASDYQCSPVGVAEGTNNISGGSTNLQISLTSSTSKTASHNFSLATAVGGGAGGLTVLATAGFQTGYSATSTVSTSTTFGGTVGYLPTSYYTSPSYRYSAGLFVYPYRQKNGNQFWVVDYYVTQP